MGTDANVVAGIPIGDGFVKIGDFGDAEGSCVDLGFTDGGIEINFSTTETEIEVDQAFSPVAIIKTAEKCSIKFKIAEASLTNFAIAFGYPSTAVAGGIFSFGGSDSMEYKTIFINTKAVSDGNRKYHFFKGYIKGGGHPIKKNDKVSIECEFIAMADTTQSDDEQLGTITDTSTDSTPPTIALTTPSPSGTVTKDTKGTVVATITEANLINESSIVYGETILIIDHTDDNALRSGTISYNATNKTITFTPTSNWESSRSLSFIATTGLKDNAGNNLAEMYVANFTATT